MKSLSKVSAARQLVRTLVASVVPRRSPAWIDAEQGLAFTVSVTPRIRDGLVLRPVGYKKPGRGRSSFDAHGL